MCWFTVIERELQPLLLRDRDKPKATMAHWAASLQLLTLCSHQQSDVTRVTSPLAAGDSISKARGYPWKLTSRYPECQWSDSPLVRSPAAVLPPALGLPTQENCGVVMMTPDEASKFCHGAGTPLLRELGLFSLEKRRALLLIPLLKGLSESLRGN